MYERINEAQQKGDRTIKTIEKVQRGETQDFNIEGGFLKRGHQMSIPQDTELKDQIMLEAHCIPNTAHLGTTKMY